MDNKLYLIHEDDYLDHIDQKLEMYHLLLEMTRALRSDLEEGETAQALRTLCGYEQQAHEMFEEWGIPDAYVESGDPDDLAQLMEEELLPAEDEDGEDNEGTKPLSCMLLDTANLMADCAAIMLNASRLAVNTELDAMMRQNDCAE